MPRTTTRNHRERTRAARISVPGAHADERFYLREIVRAAGGGGGAVQRELRLLTAAGIIRRSVQDSKSISRLMRTAQSSRSFRAQREQHHCRVIQSLALTLKTDRGTIAALEAFRKRRNVSDYQRAGTISNHEADEIVEIARRLHADLLVWLGKNHPELMPDEA
jgi:hypothetical protein